MSGIGVRIERAGWPLNAFWWSDPYLDTFFESKRRIFATDRLICGFLQKLRSVKSVGYEDILWISGWSSSVVEASDGGGGWWDWGDGLDSVGLVDFGKSLEEWRGGGTKGVASSAACLPEVSGLRFWVKAMSAVEWVEIGLWVFCSVSGEVEGALPWGLLG